MEKCAGELAAETFAARLAPLTGLFTLGVSDEEVRQDLCMLMTGVAAKKQEP